MRIPGVVGAMTFGEMLRSFPNGLHDAELHAVHVDDVRAEVVLSVAVDVRDENDHSTGHTHQPVDLLFTDVAWFKVDPPFEDGKPLALSRIDFGEGHIGDAPVPLVPAGCFACWVYVEDVNGFIRIAARNVAVVARNG